MPRMMYGRLFAALVWCVLCNSASHAQSTVRGLPPPVAQALARSQLPDSAVSVVVQELGNSTSVAALNADTARNPASVMKLATTYAALEKLGPAFTWETTAHSTQPTSDTKLSTLYLRGTGDPALTTEKFWLLLRQLRLRGIKEIGELVIDRSVFAPLAVDPAKFDGESTRVYNVPPDAFLLSFRATQFQFLPDPSTQRWVVTVDPPMPGTKVSADVKMTDGDCGLWRANLKYDIRPAPNASASFSGSVPTDCGTPALYRTLYNTPDYLKLVFTQMWAEAGGVFKGRVTEGTVPPNANLLARVESPALSEAIRPINKNSMNVSASQVFLTLAVKAGRTPATFEGAETSLRETLGELGLKFDEFRTDSGSGLPLGRGDRWSAQNIVRLLQTAYKSAVMSEMMSSLSVISMDGTATRRLKGSPVAGQAHVKTGTLTGVRSMAGYVLASSGKRYAFAIVVNHPNAASAEPAINALVNWIHATL